MSSRHRHDIYDDTPYGNPAESGDRRGHSSSSRRNRRRTDARNPHEVVQGGNLYYPQPGEYSLVERGYPPAQEPMGPHSMFDSFFGPSWDMQPHGGHGSLIGDGLFGMMRGMMSSVDRMFDDMAASTMEHNFRGGGGSSGSYYYESKTRTVGPDGIVREETVRTAPGADGRPETRRTVREGDGTPGTGRFAGNPYATHSEQGPMPRVMDGGYRSSQMAPEPDVVIEELDENGNVVASNDSNTGVPYDSGHIYDERELGRGAPREASYVQNDARPRSRWQDRYRQWRGYNA